MQTMPDVVYQVVDAYDHPHGGRILRLKLRSGGAPSVKALKNEVLAISQEGEKTPLRVSGFAAFGGKPSDARLARTGRADVLVGGGDARQVAAGWQLVAGRS